MKFIKLEPMSEKLVSIGNEPKPENSLILSHLRSTLRVLEYTNYYSIQLNIDSIGINISVSYKVHNKFYSIGVHEDRWDGKNTLHTLALNEKCYRKSDVVIPLLGMESTLDKIDLIISKRL